MKVGVTVPNMWGVEDAREMLAMGPLGTADPAFDAHALRNNMEIHLAGTAFKGKPTGGEVYADGDRWLIVVAAPLRPAEIGRAHV